MTHSARNLSTLSASRALEANFLKLLREFGSLRGAEVRVENGRETLYTGVRHPLFNGVLRSNVPRGRIRETIEATLAYFDTRGVPMIWWTGPSTRPSDLGTFLEEYRLLRWPDWRGMALDLASFRREATNAELRIDEVGNDTFLNAWMRAFSVGNGLSAPVAKVFWHFYRSRLTAASRQWYLFVGLANQVPVACSALFVTGRSAGLYSIATVPDARNRGFGTAVTLRALYEARTLGCGIALLFPSEIGWGLYRKLGFAEFCRKGRYAWCPGRAET